MSATPLLCMIPLPSHYCGAQTVLNSPLCWPSHYLHIQNQSLEIIARSPPILGDKCNPLTCTLRLRLARFNLTFVPLLMCPLHPAQSLSSHVSVCAFHSFSSSYFIQHQAEIPHGPPDPSSLLQPQFPSLPSIHHPTSSYAELLKVLKTAHINLHLQVFRGSLSSCIVFLFLPELLPSDSP